MDKKLQWHITRTLLFIILGLFNTVFIRPEDIGTWKNYLGYALLAIALVEIVLIVRQFIKQKTETE